MSNELTVNAGLSYADLNGVEESLSIENLIVSVVTKQVAKMVQSVGTSEAALNLAGLTATGGYVLMVNRDVTNYIEVRTGTGATKFCKLKPGDVALFRWGSGITAPYVIADTAACLLEYFLISP